MAALLARLAEPIVGKHCSKLWFEKGDLFDRNCLKLGLSKGLGIGTVLGGSIVKVPQIVKIVRQKSTRGLSFLSIALEALAFAITAAYNLRQGFPFSTFGESLALVVQDLVIIVLILQRDQGKVAMALLVSALILSSLAFIGHDQLSLLQAMTIPISISSKIPQIVHNARSRSTGELAAFTVFNYLLGSLARLYTTAVETGDRLILLSFGLGAGFNAILAFQMVYYWNEKEKEDKRRL